MKQIEILPSPELLEERRKTPLTVKLGIDPTRKDLHFGHLVALRQLKRLQEEGHKILIIIGDFTARIGDPTGKNCARPEISEDEIRQNSISLIKQIRSVLWWENLEVRRNSEWLSSLSALDLLQLMRSTTVQQLLVKDGFTKRLDSGSPLHCHELIYPILQGFDSVHHDVDLEVGGVDQKFNILFGRSMQRSPQMGMLVPILSGTDGRKMSKSLNNTINLSDNPLTMFTKLRRLGDELVDEFIDLLTDGTDCLDPRDRTRWLACELTSQIHGAELGGLAQKASRMMAQNQSPPWELLSKVSEPCTLPPFLRVSQSLVESGLCSSLTESRRMINSGAVWINNEKATEDMIAPAENFVLRLGRKAAIAVQQKD